MTQMLAWMEGLPETGGLFFLGISLLLTGTLLRNGLRAYNRMVAKKNMPELNATRADARLQVTQLSS